MGKKLNTRHKERYQWSINTWEDAQHLGSLGKYRLISEGYTTTTPLRWLITNSWNSKCWWGYGMNWNSHALLVGPYNEMNNL